MAKLALDRPETISLLLEVAFENNDHISDKAIWVVEYTVKQNIRLLFPHLNVFTKNLCLVKREPGIRPMAKMCELLMLDYYSNKETESKKLLTPGQLEKIATACFDWLIGQHKVAPKAHSMTCLYLLGRDFDWIHPELKMVIEQNYASGSSGYKARARKILAKLGQ